MTSITQTPTPARPAAATARMGTAADWIAHFHANADRHLTPEQLIPSGTPSPLDARTRRAFVRSFQRFALGESGDGAHLLRMATAAGDPAYTHALALLVQEEQKHAALFLRALDHLDAPALPAHWTDAAFTRLRHLIWLRTEISLFLIAETVATGYFHPSPTTPRIPRSVPSGSGSRTTSATTSASRSTASAPASATPPLPCARSSAGRGRSSRRARRP